MMMKKIKTTPKMKMTSNKTTDLKVKTTPKIKTIPKMRRFVNINRDHFLITH